MHRSNVKGVHEDPGQVRLGQQELSPIGYGLCQALNEVSGWASAHTAGNKLKRARAVAIALAREPEEWE